MRFANPVPGYIHPQSWIRPPNNTEFKVTRDCAGHIATKQGCALDIGNGLCVDKVTAVANGRVSYIDKVQGVVRIEHGIAEGHKWRSDYAHMFPVMVAVGQNVTLGQQIGEVGDAHDPNIPNFIGCHLHFAIVKDGKEVDPWPLLAQNQPKEDTMNLIKDVNRFQSPRPYRIPAGATIRAYDGKSSTPTKQNTWPSASSAACSAIVEWSGDDIPNNKVAKYIAAINGVYAGLYIPLDSIQVDTSVDSTDCTQQVNDAVKAKNDEWKEWLAEAPFIDWYAAAPKE